MEKWHGASANAAAKTVADDHRIAGPQAIHKRVEL